MNILHIDCSPRHDSHSRRLSAALLARLKAANPDAGVTRRDLGREPIAHADADYASVLSSPGALAAGATESALRLSEALIQEVERADALVLGTPINNFTVPSVLKAWLDQILRMGRTITTTPDGEKLGLLQDKPVYIAIAAGGVFSGERARQPDFLTPYLTAAFGCIGLHSLQFFPLQATAFLDHEQLAAAQEALLATLALKAADSSRA
ncbi:FMN-dependent NADH-azoreductase [Serratia rhizosphaerae]|uniref:FMN dependent NADH:quinone oxidoreductase n=1 Tax=Serratia rhizosphaerae TaxID=2597702 RepID=A0ABX6GNS0_9GAMM|nr:NAD(P)H-dependent oxidoreductase [Serratia rhizosphaerae]MEB6334409.1 NAD(P)H-dependent oxidoreductase [Serratia rhizosphaerae]QHA87892.1 flavodoxin family protein [Serratia rhizosphaerae]